ncbi:MAG: anti-sigma factor [Planctomycetota bacterium]|nr:anti-sigma factor [Planctomycetota bacterium]
MRCSRARRAISRMLDGELDDAGVADVRRHMAACPECARFHDDLARQADLMREAIPRESLLDHLVAEILAGHRLESASRRIRAISVEVLHPGRKYLKWTVVAAAVAFAAVSYALLGENRDAMTGDPVPIGGMIWFNLAFMGVAGLLFVAAPEAANFDTWLIGRLAGREIRWSSPYKVMAMRGLGLAGLLGCCIVHYLLVVSRGIAGF